MGCTSSSTHKNKKKSHQTASKTQCPAKHEHNEFKRNHTSSSQCPRIGTEPNANIVHGRDSPCSKNQNGLCNRQFANKTARGAEVHGHPKNSTKETNEKTQGTNHVPVYNKQEDLGRILDEEFLKELEMIGGKGVNYYDGDKDSVALDFEELKTKSQFPGSGFMTSERKDDEKRDMSLTLNLTDLNIEQHL